MVFLKEVCHWEWVLRCQVKSGSDGFYRILVWLRLVERKIVFEDFNVISLLDRRVIIILTQEREEEGMGEFRYQQVARAGAAPWQATAGTWGQVAVAAQASDAGQWQWFMLTCQ